MSNFCTYYVGYEPLGGNCNPMIFRLYIAILVACFLVGPVTSPGQAQSPTKVDIVHSKSGVVVSACPIASQIGCDILAQGGNAVDASVAVAFTLAVTWPEAGNIGGGGFMMIAPPDKDVVCIEYRETAPASVNEFSFAEWNNRRHARMAGVPGTVAGMKLAHKKYGILPWKILLEPAIKAAAEGFEVHGPLADSLNRALRKSDVATEKRYAEFRRVYGHPGGRPWSAGDRVVLPDLAKTLQLIANEGAKAFYNGEIAEQIVNEMRLGDGLITRQDLADYKANTRRPISGEVAGYTVYGAQLPSSGGITVLMQLRMLEALGFRQQGDTFWNADQVHLLAEVMKRSFRERAAYMGDPDFVPYPEKLLTPKHAQELAATISPKKATSSKDLAGDIPLTEGPYESPQTTHFSVVDAHGMAVSNTYTLEASFGSFIVVRGAGFLLNNEMGDFNWYPGYTNLQGSIGTKPNRLAPGKRMLSSQSPTIVRRDGKTVLTIGSPGGRTIINTVSGILAQTLLLERPLADAIQGPRLHHQWFPDELLLEDHKAFEDLIPELLQRGHQVRMPAGRYQGSAHGIAIDPETGIMTGVADWRRGGSARRCRLSDSE